MLTTRRTTMADEDDSKGPKPPDPEDRKPGDEEASPKEPEEAQPLPDRFGGLYEANIGRLIAIATEEYGVAEAPAVDLAHEVMMSLIHATDRVHDVQPWLDAAISYAAKAYALRNVVGSCEGPRVGRTTGRGRRRCGDHR